MESQVDVPPLDGPTGSAQPSEPIRVSPAASRVPVWALILGFSLLSGLGAWLVGERYLDHFKPSEDAASQAYNFTGLNKQMEWSSALNGAVAFGSLGGLLGLGMGLAGGLARRAIGWAIIGGASGLILGALAGAGPAFLVMPWHWRHRNDDPATLNLLMPLLIHAGLWVGAGLAAGLAFAIGYRGFSALSLAEAALAGVVGALCGAFLFEILGALLLPTAMTANPISETSVSRLLARLCVALLVGLAAIRCLPSPREARPTRSASA